VHVQPIPPNGWSYYMCADISIDAGGMVTYALTDGQTAQMWAYDIDADSWSQYGNPFGLVRRLHFIPKSENLLFVAGIPLPHDINDLCSAPLEAEPPPGSVLGSAAQMLSTDPGG